MAFIVANNGPRAGHRYELKGFPSVMGRHPDCAIVVDVGAVSRQHAQIVEETNDFYVEDLQSRNGTFVNDHMIQGRQLLNDGDQVRVCDVAFSFYRDLPAEAPTTGRPPLGSMARLGRETVLIDDIEGQESSSTIMSKVEVSSKHGRLQYGASVEAKLDAILEITRALGRALALDEVLPGVLNSLFKIFVQADRGFIVMRTKDGNLVPMWTQLRRQDVEDTIRISRTIANQVMESKEAILSADAASDERFEMSQSIADFRIRSMMCAPLLDSEGNAMGVLQIDTLDQQKRFQKEDLELLASIAIQAGIAIDNAQLHDEALKQREVERDLEVAYEVQRGFLPDKPPDLQGYQFFNFYQPANHIGGDYYDYIPLSDGRIAVVVADVVGHGVAAALLMAKVAAEARFCLASESNVGAAVGLLNDAITNLHLDRFVTMVMTVIDPKTNDVFIVNAGHMAPIVRKTNGELVEPGEELRGLPLGITGGMEYKSYELELASGQSMTMYTDGINECVGTSGQMYGIKRIHQQINDAKDSVPASLGKSIVDDLRRFMGKGVQDDDMCLVSFGRV